MKITNLVRVGRLLMGVLIMCCGTSALAYPFSQDDIKQLLVQEAKYQGVSPSLVLAIAKVESDFNPAALSHAGAKGVMQIMPATAKNGFQVETHELFNAKVNIRVGVAFIKQLLEQYGGQVDIALSHYNGGSRVQRPNGKLAVIPATRAYVNKVQMYNQRYQNQGYNDAAAFTKHATLAHQQINKPRTLSYGDKMTLDELDYRDMALRSKASLEKKHTTLLEKKTNTPNPRINQLQDLREHNLTRLLPAKLSKSVINTSDELNKTVLVERATKLAGVSFIKGPKQRHKKSLVAETGSSHVDLPLADIPLAENAAFKPVPLEFAGTKQQQVASWEAIFE